MTISDAENVCKLITNVFTRANLPYVFVSPCHFADIRRRRYRRKKEYERDLLNAKKCCRVKRQNIEAVIRGTERRQCRVQYGRARFTPWSRQSVFWRLRIVAVVSLSCQYLCGCCHSGDGWWLPRFLSFCQNPLTARVVEMLLTSFEYYSCLDGNLMQMHHCVYSRLFEPDVYTTVCSGAICDIRARKNVGRQV